MSLLTLAEYKALTNTSVATYDTYVTNLLAPVQSEIENYCDRYFDLGNYYNWFAFDRYIVLPQYPVKYLLFLGSPNQVSSCTITGTYTVEVQEDLVAVTNEAFTTTEFLFSAYANITLLTAAITAAFPAITFSVVAAFASMPPVRLRTGVVTDFLYGADQIKVSHRIPDNSDRIIEIAYDASFGFTYSFEEAFGDVVYVAWRAGYATADVPQALKMITANIIHDIVNESVLGISGLVKSETLTNYSITYASPELINRAIFKYLQDLEPWKKKCV